MFYCARFFLLFYINYYKLVEVYPCSQSEPLGNHNTIAYNRAVKTVISRWSCCFVIKKSQHRTQSFRRQFCKSVRLRYIAWNISRTKVWQMKETRMCMRRQNFSSSRWINEIKMIYLSNVRSWLITLNVAM